MTSSLPRYSKVSVTVFTRLITNRNRHLCDLQSIIYN